MKKLTLIFLLVLCGFLPVDAQSYVWKIAGKMTRPVWGGQLAYDIKTQGNLIYILGGYSDSTQTSVDLVQEYDIAKNSWRIVGHMKKPRMDFVADIWNNSIMYFGDSLVYNKTLESFNFKSGDSTSVVYDSTNNNFGRSYSTGHIVGDTLYVVGGVPLVGPMLPYIVGYDLSQKKVILNSSELTSQNNRPRQHMSFIIGSNIYIFGGAMIGISNSISQFNIPAKTLTNLSVSLLEHRAAGAAVYNPIIQKGFIIGGYNEISKALLSVEQVTIQKDGTLSITPGPQLNTARTNLMAVNYKGKVVVIGGKDENGKVVSDVELLDTLTAVRDAGKKLPAEFALHQNYPNPFNPGTAIRFDLAKPASISLDVYSVLGQRITILEKGDYQAGSYSTAWNGKDGFNNTVPSGIYFLQLRAGNFIQTRKMVLLK
jgi:hypothetical protein